MSFMQSSGTKTELRVQVLSNKARMTILVIYKVDSDRKQELQNSRCLKFQKRRKGEENDEVLSVMKGDDALGTKGRSLGI